MQLTNKEIRFLTIPEGTTPLDALKALEAQILAGEIIPSDPRRMVGVMLTDEAIAAGRTDFAGGTFPPGKLVVMDVAVQWVAVGADFDCDEIVGGGDALIKNAGAASGKAGFLNGDMFLERAQDPEAPR